MQSESVSLARGQDVVPEHRGPGLRPHPRPYPREHRPPALRHVRQVKHPGRYPVTNIQILLGQVDHLGVIDDIKNVMSDEYLT